MDERIERLRRVELEALGTARREFISTADSKKARNARIEELERERMSNIPGTDAKRVAEAHQSQLEDWANVYKKIGDTGDLEHLDNLLNGQSHRHHLSTVVRESGGQEYIKPDNTKLKECKDELEARFHLAQTHSLTRTATEQSTKDFAVEELTNSKLDGVASAKPNLSKDRDVESNGSSPQVRLSAKAPQFVPKRSSSAAIQAKTERYSEAKHELAEYVIERAHAELNVSSLRESHIFGNHLLPGRYRSQPPKTNVSEQSSPSPSERKISSKRPGLFLSPPPSSPRVRDENSSSFEVSHKAPATPKAPPQSIEAREVLSEQIMDRNAQASSSPRPKNETKRVIDTMQQSIHAPKLRKEPFGQGLDSSKYARPKYP